MTKIKGIRFYFLVSGQLKKFEEYAEYIESTLRRELNKYEKTINELNNDQVDEFIDCYYDEIAQYQDDFPSIMRNSLFISIYSFLEEKVIDLCDQPDKTAIKLKDLQGNGISRASVFIKKVKKDDFPEDTKEWHFIKNANQIRNCIVHCGGDIDKAKNPKKITNAVNELENVSLSRHNRIILNEKFCFEFIHVVEKFLGDLYK